MLLRLSIAQRLMLFILLGVAAVLVTLIATDYFSDRRRYTTELREYTRLQSDLLSHEVSSYVDRTESAVQQLALAVAGGHLPPDAIVAMVRRSLESHPFLSGMGVYLDEAGGEPFLPVVFRHEGQVRTVQLEDLPEYRDGRYRKHDWYFLPKLLGPCWTEPYFGVAEDHLMVSYGVPILEPGTGKCLGVAGADLHLDWLERICGGLHGSRGQYVFLLSGQGRIMVHPRAELVMGPTVFSLADRLGNAEMRRIARRMTRGDSDVVDWTSFLDGSSHWMAFSSVPGTTWSLGVVFPQDYMHEILGAIVRTKLIYGALALTLLVGIAWIIAWAISTPIRRFETAVRAVAAGDLDAPVPEAEGLDEVASLTRSFRSMTVELKKQMTALQVAAEERARIESDLQAARAIQMGLLPRSFDVGREDLEIYGLMQPAREIGGDFYDFGFLDNRFFVAIGDVSGKGVPAALFMSLTRTDLRFYLGQADVGTALTRTNAALAEDNDAMMFATAFCAVVDLSTGECTFANAGHNPTLLVRDGEVREFPNTEGFLLGPNPDATYEGGSIGLLPGDTLVLYTDGIVEAEGPGGFYGMDRMQACLARTAHLSCEGAVRALRADVQRFADGYPQSDDITVLMVRYRPSETEPPPSGNGNAAVRKEA